MIELTFLGTSSMVPTKDRNVQGIFLSYNAEGLLIDCGEGTQRQMNIAGINRNKVKRILISHWHGDHVSGLIGLIQTIGNCNPDKEMALYIYGPRETKKHLSHLLNSCIFESKVKLDVKEIDAKNPKTVIETEDFFVEAANLKHSIPCIGYRFVEKDKRKMNVSKLDKLGLKGPDVGILQQGKAIKIGSKIINPDDVSSINKGKVVGFILDTGICSNAYKIAQDSDVLVCEATFISSIEDRALRFRHLTARDAGLIANKANSKKLVLTHFSQRYKAVTDVLDDAKSVFQNTIAAFDFMKIKI